MASDVAKGVKEANMRKKWRAGGFFENVAW